MNEQYYKKILKVLDLDPYTTDDIKKIEELIKIFIDADPDFCVSRFRRWFKDPSILGAV